MAKAYTLITGATGFIGSHVAEKLLWDGSWPVIAIVRGGKGYKNTAQLEKKGAILVRGNFYDLDLLNSVFREFTIQNVIHIAALTGEGAGSTKDYYDVNVHGTEALLSVFHKNRSGKFILCSSVGVLGTIPAKVPADLSTRLNADNIYHRSKLAAEKRVYDFMDRGLNAFIIRPTITYGKRDAGFSPTLIRMVRKRLLLLPARDNKVHLVSVSSLAEMFLRIMNIDGLLNRVFIAADEGPVVFRELVNLIYAAYFAKNYPSFLKLPSSLFRAFETIFSVLHLNKWTGRIQRISKDWFFDTRETDALIGFQPANTNTEFLKYLRTLR
ncbi:MAG: NAD-dependent epimerase/dehydratase family protein [Deltaproteobacteria bacterium]|nr:NAD-dependent epimerase/dehydratase family protein [Deltaproteobacteria bacterium]